MSHLYGTWMLISVFTRAHPEPSECSPHLFHFFKINFNMIPSMPTSSKQVFRSLHQNPVWINFLSNVYHTPHSFHPPLFDHPYLVRSMNHDVSYSAVSISFLYFPLRSKSSSGQPHSGLHIIKPENCKINKCI